MSTIPVKIMLHGLIALAPVLDSSDPNHHISALLFDGRTPSAIVQCLDGQHLPKLEFLVSQEGQEKCSDAGCAVENDTCICTTSLVGKRIWLELGTQFSFEGQGLSGNGDEALANNHGIPANKTAAASLLYVANLAKEPFNMRINPEYLAPHPRNKNLLARVEVPFSTLTACSLSKREDQGDAYVQAMSFRKIGKPSDAGDRSQALAQMVMAGFMVDEAQRITVHMKDFDDESAGNGAAIVVAPHPGHGYMIKLSNEAPMLGRGDPCDDGIARHFALFYEFAQNPPNWADRLIPHVRFTLSTRASDVDPEACKDPTLNLQERPICPIVSFFP